MSTERTPWVPYTTKEDEAVVRQLGLNNTTRNALFLEVLKTRRPETYKILVDCFHHGIDDCKEDDKCFWSQAADQCLTAKATIDKLRKQQEKFNDAIRLRAGELSAYYHYLE